MGRTYIVFVQRFPFANVTEMGNSETPGDPCIIHLEIYPLIIHVGRIPGPSDLTIDFPNKKSEDFIPEMARESTRKTSDRFCGHFGHAIFRFFISKNYRLQKSKVAVIHPIIC